MWFLDLLVKPKKKYQKNINKRPFRKAPTWKKNQKIKVKALEEAKTLLLLTFQIPLEHSSLQRRKPNLFFLLKRLLIFIIVILQETHNTNPLAAAPNKMYPHSNKHY